MAKKKKKKVIVVKASAGDPGELINKWDVLNVLLPGLISLLNVKRGILEYELDDIVKPTDDLFEEGNQYKVTLMGINPDVSAIMIKVEHWKNIVEDLVNDAIVELNKCIKGDTDGR